MTMAAVRTVTTQVYIAGIELFDVLSARGEIQADGGWPTCSVFVTTRPVHTGGPFEGEFVGEDNEVQVRAGATNLEWRFMGNVRRFRASSFPKGIEMVCMGTLAYAAEWSPAEEILFDEEWPTGGTDQELIAWVLDHVPNVLYDTLDIDGSGVTLGVSAPEAFDWKAGTSAWSYIQQLDRASLYRTYQDQDGIIRRVKMIGHPNATPDFTLAPADILDGARGSRDTERTRNYVLVQGHDYGDGLGPVQGVAYGENGFQGPGDEPATRHPEIFSSDMIESGVDPDDLTWDGEAGLRADEIAAEIILDVNKEFVEAEIPSWRDNRDEPGMTVLVDALERLAIGEPMWLQGYMWEVSDRGWQATYRLTGGGLAPEP